MPKGYQAREGYELWHPNRDKAESKTTKAIVSFVLFISAALLVIITLGGWERLQSTTVGLMTIGWALLYVLFALLVMRWNRGVLPVAAALSVIMIIFAAVAAGGWFARDKPGLDSPALPEDLLVIAARDAGNVEGYLRGGDVSTDDVAPVEWLIDRSILGYASSDD